MEVSLGFLNSPENILIRRFSLQKELLGEETVGINDLNSFDLDGLLLPSTNLDEETLNKLKDELKFFPILKGSQITLNFSDFKNLNPLMALSKINELKTPWILKNNLLLIENFFETVSVLKNSLHKDREAFLGDIWYLIKNNLGAIDLTLYFNDLVNGKSQIIQRKVSGKKHPEIMDLTDADSKILSTLKYPSETIIYYKEKQEFFILMGVLGSPILLIGKCFNFSPLQKALIKSLFKGLE